MKVVFTIIFIIISSNIFAQDSLKVKQIDSLILQINTSNLPVQCDTLVKDYPEVGLKMVIYLSQISNGRELIKYVNFVDATRTENGLVNQTKTSNTFYYNHSKLIKVEEYLIQGKEKKTIEWYYHQDKPIHHTATLAKASERATFLITLANEMLKKFNQ